MSKIAASPLWTIDELSAQVVAALAKEYEGQVSGRVREVPDLRTIRYYTTIGLLDRPAEMRGRTAFYNQRHLLQIISIKRLQARGLSLREVQEQLLGLSDAKLRRIADLTPGTNDRPLGTARAQFWKMAPHSSAHALMRGGETVEMFDLAEHMDAVDFRELADDDGVADAGRASLRESFSPELRAHSSASLQEETEKLNPAIKSFTGVELSPDVTLLLQCTQLPDHRDMEQIRAAAEPLLNLLEIRRLVRSRTERKTT